MSKHHIIYLIVSLLIFLIIFIILYFKEKGRNELVSYELKKYKDGDSVSDIAQLRAIISTKEHIINELEGDKSALKNNDLELRAKVDELESRLEIAIKSAEKNKKIQKTDSISNEPNYFSEIDLDESGFYQYKYNYDFLFQYEDVLSIIKSNQLDMINKDKAFICTVLGLDKTPLLKSLQKLSLLALNSSIDLVINKIKHNNFQSCEKRILNKFNSINKLLSVFNSHINSSYLELKLKEASASFEYNKKKEDIRLRQQELKEQIREEQKAFEEMENIKKEALQKENDLKVEVEEAMRLLESKHDDEKNELELKIASLKEALAEAHNNSVRAISNAQLTSCGHVYIISNIGSFGENVYKIGMTRRSEPMQRVNELGDASVPFIFDVHALIYSENARKLESDLHKKFHTLRVNKINQRKEFFKVSLEDIKVACKDLGLNVEFEQIAEAKEYRESKMNI